MFVDARMTDSDPRRARLFVQSVLRWRRTLCFALKASEVRLVVRCRRLVAMGLELLGHTDGTIWRIGSVCGATCTLGYIVDTSVSRYMHVASVRDDHLPAIIGNTWQAEQCEMSYFGICRV